MNFFDLSFWQSIVSNFVATIFGVFLGVLLALIVDNRKESKKEKVQKKKILELLRDELIYNWKVFQAYDMKVNTQNRTDINIALWTMDSGLKTEIWRSFSDSGDLKWIKDVKLLSYISDAYFFVKGLSQLSANYYRMFLSQANSDSEISGWTSNNLRTELENTIFTAKSIVNIAIQKIEESLK